ncbi:hypothetical protein K435DRAFT_737865 [Dendrothele bispora CBS 962.96]|uniref:Ubiquitin 3 binding protein But2 C-terminal domain-containing protein n=1 Tax=Dendrothele bispora (strain CBS 962.96) TaxID=1314807 RepID=A0A4S8KRY8_DENBC|nr:hypothetical protein K435DRAFT_737865 [Dendrothele bispora CBS 962.96]
MDISNSNYELLSQDEDVPLDSTKSSGRNMHLISTLTYHAIRLSFIVIGFCAIADVCLAAYIAHLYFKTTSTVSVFASGRVDSHPIPLRNTYIGFDKLYSDLNRPKVPQHAPVINLPRASAQISSAEPTKVFPQWTEFIVESNGLVPRYAINLHATTQISTIVQFRVIDYGMEDCELVLKVPPNSQPNSTKWVSTDFRSEKVAQVDVWSLSTEVQLDFRSLSWTTRPKRSSHVGRLDGSTGNNQIISRFHCPWGSYHTFEFSCDTSDCGIDVTNFSKEAIGVYILQHQSLQ